MLIIDLMSAWIDLNIINIIQINSDQFVRVLQSFKLSSMEIDGEEYSKNCGLFARMCNQLSLDNTLTNRRR